MTLRRLIRLPPWELAVLVEAALLFVPVEIGLRLLAVDSLLARLMRSPADETARHAVVPARAAVLVERLAGWYPLEATCLKKSLVLLRILRRRGLRAELKLGVRTADSGFASHAWVECEGERLLDDGGAGRFTPLPLSPRAS